MKKALLFLLLVLPLYFLAGIYFLDKEYFLCPIEYPKGMAIRSDSRGDGLFGAERNGGRLHQGLDLFAQVGAPVLAVRSGKVLAATRNHGMGNYVIIKHSGNLTSLYGHLNRIYVKKGIFVRQGQVIAGVGKTGNANYRDIQPHLHLEVRKGGIHQDPLEYLQ